jgi:hypothetical protein
MSEVGEGGGHVRIAAFDPYQPRLGLGQAAKPGTSSAPDFRTENSIVFQGTEFGTKLLSFARLAGCRLT